MHSSTLVHVDLHPGEMGVEGVDSGGQRRIIGHGEAIAELTECVQEYVRVSV